MKIIMVAVVSANGKLTKGDNPHIYEWTSKEDQEFFSSLVRDAKLIVMGSTTYEAVRANLKHKEGRLRIVLTSNPQKFEDQKINGQLEFSPESPNELVERIRSRYDEMFLVGGSKIYSSFTKAGLVDEIYLTIEPVVFGEGKNLFADEEFEKDIKLESFEKLNEKGTILLKYKVE